VVAGVIVDGDNQWKALEKGLWDIVCEYIPKKDRKGFIFHATELFSGGKYFDRDTWPKHKRWEILDAVVTLIRTNKLPIVYGFVDRLKSYANIERHVPGDNWATKNKDQMAHGIAFAECAKRIQEWMTIYGGSEVGLIIAEDTTRVKRFLKAIHTQLRDPSSEIFQIEDVPIKPLSRIIDTIHFAQKHETSMLQLADACAFVIKRELMGRNDVRRFFEPIAPSILWPHEKPEKLKTSSAVGTERQPDRAPAVAAPPSLDDAGSS
jgi:hypothetical protein